ncbi:cobalt ABC transporter, inner membrane subunit CbiQ [Desulforamulus ruminis DSM 2154]|uniref:Cobalt ABC transporter, inner membrane subunit CbiQ n=2 Tax=Desulforamulus ruminis TaxID=1564 RepID=F6DKL1_DESRL|nr:cobalt ABC transporter, inner membrane subunit CbiQ [Desulforamulus ruminis DSM 2154]
MRGVEDSSVGRSWVRQVDPRVKVVSLMIFIITITTLQHKTMLMAAGIFLLTAALLAGVPLKRILMRLLYLIPFGGLVIVTLPLVIPGEPLFSLDLGFVQLVASREGWESAVLPCLRMTAAFLGMIFLTATTSIGDIGSAFRQLGVPAFLIMIIEFTLRYIAVLQEELVQMQRAAKSRGFRMGRNFWHGHTMKTLGRCIAMLFLRSHERAERVYYAMLSRGYSGQWKGSGPVAKIRLLDLGWGTAMIAVAWTIKFLELGGARWFGHLK